MFIPAFLCIAMRSKLLPFFATYFAWQTNTRKKGKERETKNKQLVSWCVKVEVEELKLK